MERALDHLARRRGLDPHQAGLVLQTVLDGMGARSLHDLDHDRRQRVLDSLWHMGG